ncbi:tripartite tricarboxylate transporter receptor family protein [Bordetella holmesii 70147]|nr:tripartite tricarboxylate transporter receptor family protein [Bordetella holmesii 70147]KCV05146.1 tripartite tricarboxylate transporter family receptor [Bordetella holmesii CDC-H629-BH]
METAVHTYSATRRSMCLAAALAALALGPLAAQAKAPYPDHPIRLVVPFPPGGTTDTLGRLLAPRLAERLGQSVIVENRAGAATQIGAMEVARSPADGYTLLLTGPSTFTANPAVNTQSPYDPLKSFDYLGLTGTMPVILLAHPKAPFKDVKSMVEQAKREPGRMFYGSFGPRSIMHFAGETLNASADVKLTSVAYKGSSPAMTDLLGGQIPMTFDTVVVSAPYVKSDKVSPLAVTTAKRSTLLPDVPTMTEVGYPMDISSWLGIAAPGRSSFLAGMSFGSFKHTPGPGRATHARAVPTVGTPPSRFGRAWVLPQGVHPVCGKIPGDCAWMITRWRLAL